MALRVCSVHLCVITLINIIDKDKNLFDISRIIRRYNVE